MTQFFIRRSTEIDPVSNRAVVLAAFNYFVRLALPVVAVALIAGLVANIAQLLGPPGFIVTTKPLGFKFSRIVPHFGEFFRRGLFSFNGLWNFAKSLIKIALIGFVAFLIIRGEWPKLTGLYMVSLWSAVAFVASLAVRLMLICALLMLVLSIPDYLIQKWQFREQLKMSVQEMKEEIKEEEGDPQVKGRIQQRMAEMLRKNLREVVPQADVVVTNPTHLAVALRYDPAQESGPRVLIKGEDEVALTIRRIARDAGVPVEENKPVARLLYAEVPEGEIVPPAYWDVLVIIFNKVQSANERRRRMRNG
jgi:flagellar biosynthetic protein FlhB